MANPNGRAKRYENEQQQRLSVIIRPRYRDALDILARQLQVPMSQIVEMAVYQLASKITVDETPVIDLVRSPSEWADYLTHIKLPRSSPEIGLQRDKVVREYLSKHDVLKTPVEAYFVAAINDAGKSVEWFNLDELKMFIIEQWKVGVNIQDTVKMIKLIGKK